MAYRKEKSAEALKAEIVERSSERKRKSIERFWELLLNLDKKGVTRLTVGVVGQACEDAGILKKQSIWNSSGVDYRDLLAAFAREKGKSRGIRAVAEPNISNAILAVNDMDARIRLLAIVEDNDRLQNEVTRLRAFYKRVRFGDSPSPDAPAEGSTTKGAGTLPVSTSAIKRFLTSEWQDEAALQADKAGALYASDGMPVAPPGFLQELRRLLGGD